MSRIRVASAGLTRVRADEVMVAKLIHLSAFEYPTADSEGKQKAREVGVIPFLGSRLQPRTLNCDPESVRVPYFSLIVSPSPILPI